MMYAMSKVSEVLVVNVSIYLYTLSVAYTALRATVLNCQSR